jgi:hypothetical protein
MNERDAQEQELVTNLSPAGATPEPPASGAQATEAAQQQGPADYADIVIFCHPRNVSNLVQALKVQIEHAAGELPMIVLWSGVSGVLHQGVVVLEWKGIVKPAFLHNLSIDHEIFDYVIYTYAYCWAEAEENQGSGGEQEAQTDQDAKRGEIDRAQFV